MVATWAVQRAGSTRESYRCEVDGAAVEVMPNAGRPGCHGPWVYALAVRRGGPEGGYDFTAGCLGAQTLDAAKAEALAVARCALVG